MRDQAEDIGEYRLGRGIDYLGSIARMLRDLSGYATLIYELLQNADDAPGATAVRFDITPEALVVWNDGIFGDCKRQDLHPDQCPWLEERGERCDFHRFRSVSSGDKGRRVDLTGAFGIGFTAVYQITDQPEIISSGQHWILDETQSEGERIRVHHQCPVCEGEAGTRFILPWARDPNSEFRRLTNTPSVGEGAPAELAEVLERVVPTGILFLRKIRQVVLLRNSEVRTDVVREDEGEDTLISDGRSEQIWRVISGDFDGDANEMRLRYPSKLEKSSEIALAIPFGNEIEGLLCAYLPTEERTGLPFHINADFFPVSDRKRLVVEGYQGEWNRLAVQKAAQLLADRLLDLREVCGPSQLWSLLVDAHEASKNPTARARDLSLEAFWGAVEPGLRRAPILQSIQGEWVAPESAYVVRDPEEEDAAAVLSSLGGVFAHPELREFCFRLPYERSLGMSQLTIVGMANLLLQNGLAQRTEIEDLLEALHPEAARQVLLKELDLLIGRAPEESRRRGKLISGVGLAPGSDGAIWPWIETFRTNERTRDLFELFAKGSVFLDEDQLPRDALHVAALSPAFSPADGISWLSAYDPEELQASLREELVNVTQLLEWFEAQKSEFIDDDDLAAQLAQVPCFPTSTGFRPLSDLALPGDFTDDLGLADIVDVGRVGDSLPLLKKLGARPLTFDRYVAEFVPRAATLSVGDPDRWWKLILLVSEKLGQIEDDPEVRQVLGDLPCVRITEGGFAKPPEAYFASDLVRRILGHVRTAFLPRVRPRSVEAFYTWVGVATKPRPDDIMEQIRQLTESPPAESSVAAITNILDYLATELNLKRPQEWGHLASLSDMRWLPARGDRSRWYRPRELYTTFQDYLFVSQARFIGVPVGIQRTAAALLEYLGVLSTPSTDQIVAHLLHCSESGATMNQEVYAALNQRVEDPALEDLANVASILLPSGKWVSPTFVFWGQHPFGRFRATLGSDFQRFATLLNRLGVREHPDYTDASAVLLEMATEFGGTNSPVEDEDDVRVHAACWRILGDALDADVAAPQWFIQFKGRKVIRDPRGVLTPPDRVFFDDVPGLADRFPSELKIYLIRRPEGAWRAMRASGVRDLSRAVETRMLELGERWGDDGLHSMIRTRVRQIGRVLDPSDPTWWVRLSRTIEELAVISSSRLIVQYSLKGFEMVTGPADLEALFVPDDLTLYVVPAEPRNWLVFARELARAISPDTPPGSLAANLALVLSAHNEEVAERQLDMAGVPRLEESPEGTAVATVVETFGGEQAPSEDQDEIVNVWPPDTVVPADIDGSDAPGEQAVVESQVRKETGDGGAASSTAGDRQRLPGEHWEERPRSRLRSYVLPAGDSATERDRVAGEEEGDSAVDRAGIARVLQFELESGRTPDEKPHHFPGYDIQSHGEDGRVERYIEVKSIAGPWDAYGVSLTARQFSEARKLGSRFWLYVVARAERPDFSIHCIQDPASKVDQFMFDEAWIWVGETSAAGRPILPVHLIQADARLPDRNYLPFYDIPVNEPGSAGAEAGWVEWDGDAPSGSFLVQVLGDALKPLAGRGAVVLVEPLNAVESAPGDPLLLDLGGQKDPETGTDLAFRVWPAGERPEAGDLTLAPLNPAVPPLEVEDPQLVRVVGRVRAEWARSSPEPG